MENDEQQEIETEHYESEDGESAATKIRQDLARCRKEKQEYLQGWQRCQADAVNIRREEDRRRKEYTQFAAESIIRELIHVAVTFDHAFAGTDETNAYTRGFRQIYAQFMSILARQGVERIETEGKPFDSVLHEAVENIPVAEPERDHHVIEEVEGGYVLYGKVIKPSKVKVGEFKNES